MPIRVKSRPQSQVEPPPRSPSISDGVARFGSRPRVPDIDQDDSFREVVKKLSVFISRAILLPSTFEQLRTSAAGDGLHILVDYLSQQCTNPAIVNALLALKWHYGAATEDKELNEARASACEIVAWRLLTHLSEREVVDYCLYEIPAPEPSRSSRRTIDLETGDRDVDETSPLIGQSWADFAESARNAVSHTGSTKRSLLLQSVSRLTMSMSGDSDGEADGDEGESDPTVPFVHLNGLEIAAIANAKRFLSQNVVQKIVTGIWNGDIVFWDSLSVHATKRPGFYNPKTADPFSRLRVPKYLKSFEVLFFAIFLMLYYAILVERNPERIMTTEIWLYIWIAAYCYDEISEWIDAGSIFYATDVWNIFDIVMILIGIAFATMRIVGLSNNDAQLVDFSFDVLALEALFMVPRVCSILSLSPYWGTLIPCLKAMGKDFIKFMVLVVIVYLGFLTTFTLVARDSFTFPQMSWILTKIFFGNSSVGFDIMEGIDVVFGPPLMIIFVTLSSFLLMGSLTGMLSNSFSRVILHAREEYLYVYSVYVLEASTSNRLTHFYPPFNLLALVIFRPLRLFLPSDDKFRAARIMLLKATHLPIVGLIQLYELVRNRNRVTNGSGTGGPVARGGFKGPVQVTRGSISSETTKRFSRPALPPLNDDVDGTTREASNRHGGSGDGDDNGNGAAAHSSEAGVSAPEDDTRRDQPTDVEARIAELSAKIDRLTDLVLRLEKQGSPTSTYISA